MLAGGLIGGARGAKGGVRFDAWRAGKSLSQTTSESLPVLDSSAIKPKMSLSEAVGQQRADSWISKGRELADSRDPALSRLLSDDQVGALYGYTTNPGYQMVNPALRGMEPLPREVEAFTQHINDGLDKLPAYTGETFRGMDSLPSEILEGYMPGNTVADPTFMSTDINQGFRGPIQMRIEGFSGKK